MSDQHRSQPQASVRDRVFALLRAFGTTTIFGNPGSRNRPQWVRTLWFDHHPAIPRMAALGATLPLTFA
jgi:hypothetical protein